WRLVGQASSLPLLRQAGSLPHDPPAARQPGDPPMTLTCSLSVVLRLEENGPQVTREPVTDADLAEALGQGWLQDRLRRGRPAAAEPFTLTAKNLPLAYLRVPLPPLLRRARTVGEVDGRWLPVLFTEEALTRCERFARKGAASQPPIETGAVQIGPLCSCPET